MVNLVVDPNTTRRRPAAEPASTRRPLLVACRPFQSILQEAFRRPRQRDLLNMLGVVATGTSEHIRPVMMATCHVLRPNAVKQ
jgi:hypothetical protein